MATDAASTHLATQARRSFVEGLIGGVPAVVQAVDQSARVLLSQVALPALQVRRRELVEDLQHMGSLWLRGLLAGLRAAAASGLVAPLRTDEMSGISGRNTQFTLVDNDIIEGEILSSRLALAMMDRASWEFTDLRSRMTMLEGRDELDANDILRPHVLARIVSSTWRSAGLSQSAWGTAQTILHDEFSHFAEEAYHETNRWLIQRRVLPEIDLRPFIRRTRQAPGAAPGPQTGFAVTGMAGADGMLGGGGASSGRAAGGNSGSGGSGSGGGGGGGFGSNASGGGSAGANRTQVGEETRLMTRPGVMARGADHAEAVLGRLNRLISRQLPEFAQTAPNRTASVGLNAAINDAQQGIAKRLGATDAVGRFTMPVSTPALLEELHQRKQVLKEAASTPGERATIEIVALLFQSILTEERLPATIRVWFARLQMPVLRVAVTEPDFFATTDHPARRLIDRMGACVMGFDGAAERTGDLLETEIKRVVQVIEAYPDTGRRVFQTVLTEFEKFLEHYFKNENEASRRGVSLAQQVEQRETLAIQYTIELRKMLDKVPVQEIVREFLFHVWADVLAMTAVKTGGNSEETKAMQSAAANLIWSASAKVSREERAEVIRRIAPLLKTVRDGMQNAGVPLAKQNEHIQRLNSSLAAAFTAKVAPIPPDRLEQLMARLEALEELLPDADDVEIDESMVLDLSGHESSELEVVAEGGSMPTPAMLSWARELQVGSWYMLDYRNRNESVQLAWQGLRRQLTLFVSPQGRGILFQQHRLGAFLQAGLMVPAQEEALTVRATRNALAKLDVDPGRLLG